MPNVNAQLRWPEIRVLPDEAQYRLLFETIPHGVILLDGSGRVIDANPAAEKVLGLNLGEMLGRALGEQGLRFVRENCQPVEEADLPSTLALRSAQRFRDVVLGVFNPRRGQYRWIAVDAAPQVRAGERLPWQIYVAFTDITEHRRVRDELRAGEARFRLLAENSTDLVSRLTPDGRFLYASPAARTLLGVEPEELVGKSVFEFVHPEDEHLLREVPGRLHDEAAVVTVAYRFRNRAGGYCWLESTCRAVTRAEAGEGTQIQTASRDVTERKRTEEQLKRLSVAVEQSPASVVITDTEGRIEYVNPKFERVTGYSRQEVLGQNPRVLKSGEMNCAGYRDLWETLLRGEEWHGEFHNRRKDGELFWEWAVISPIKDEQGRVTHFLAVKEDITERKLAEQVRQRLEAQLRESQKLEAFGQLAGGVAHDFNNILTVIHSHACLLQDGRLEESQCLESVREIARSAERASNLTAQLLAFSRRQLLEQRALDLNETLQSMTRMLQRLIGEHIVLEALPTPNGAVVHADPGMMEQVILNLVVNARDAMPRGGRLSLATRWVTLQPDEVSPDRGARAGSFVCLSVSDTGSGIPPEIQDRIFEPFFTTKEVGKGTGLGLSTVLGIVEQHQGWVAVESGMDRGTTFRIYLPRLDQVVPRPEVRPVAGPVEGGTETVLVVEDETPLRLLVRTVLERQGYRVLEAENGRQALELWSVHKDEIHLLLTDMVLPEGISGIEIAQQIQSDAPEIKVIFTSGYDEESLDTAFQRRGNRFLAKPYDPVRLTRMLRECLDE